MKQPKPNQLWLVAYECRWSVVVISPCGTGFFAPGQEQLWPLGEAIFIRRIMTPSMFPVRVVKQTPSGKPQTK